MRIAAFLALALVATGFAVVATPTASAGACSPDEVAQVVCGVVGIAVDGVNFACQKEFGSDCVTFG